MSPQSINIFVAAVQFFYTVTLEMPWGKECFPRVRVASTLPVVLDAEEVAEFFDYVPSLKYRAALMLCYGAGLRIGEAVAVKVSDIDSKRMLILVKQGKGSKDRYVVLSPRLLAVLRRYWRRQAPRMAVSLVAREPPSIVRRAVWRLSRCLETMRADQARYRPHAPPLCRFPDYAA